MPQTDLDATYGESTTSTAKGGQGFGEDFLEATNRLAAEWDISSLPGGDVVSVLVLTLDVGSTDVSTASAPVHLYDSDGQGDPSADTAANMFTRAAAGSSVGTLSATTTGSVDIALSAAARTALEDARTAGTQFALGLSDVNMLSQFYGINFHTATPSGYILKITHDSGEIIPLLQHQLSTGDSYKETLENET